MFNILSTFDPELASIARLCHFADANKDSLPKSHLEFAEAKKNLNIGEAAAFFCYGTIAASAAAFSLAPLPLTLAAYGSGLYFNFQGYQSLVNATSILRDEVKTAPAHVSVLAQKIINQMHETKSCFSCDEE